MPELIHYQECIEEIFEEKLHVVVPSSDTNLFDAGVLDSLSFVDLLFELEHRFGVRVSLEDLEFNNFQSITRISEFVAIQAGRKNDETDRRWIVEAGERVGQVDHG